MKSAVPCTGRAYLNAGGPFRPNCGIIYPVSACEPQAKHEFSGTRLCANAQDFENIEPCKTAAGAVLLGSPRGVMV